MITVKELGGPTEVARICGLRAPTVHGWKQIPEKHCPAIERHRGGEFTVERMRPDIPWLRVPDPSWPHPDGRPVIDVANVAPQTGATPAAEGA